MNLIRYFLLFSSAGLILPSCSQPTNLAEKLGYQSDARMLIIHADDIGMCQSVNQATIDAFQQGGINSASIMVPCPWFKDIASFVVENPKLDFGLHLTLTSEWENYKWNGVLPASQIPSLLDAEGFFFSTVDEVIQQARLDEVEAELRAQVQRALDFGIRPTHLDSHMGTLFSHPDFFSIYQKIGREFNMPVFLPMDGLKSAPELVALIDPTFIPVNRLYQATPDVDSSGWNDFYSNILTDLPPGLNELIVHLGYDNEELRSVCVDHPYWGAEWRQRDLDFVLSDDFKNLIREKDIKLVTYGQLQSIMK